MIWLYSSLSPWRARAQTGGQPGARAGEERGEGEGARTLKRLSNACEMKLLNMMRLYAPPPSPPAAVGAVAAPPRASLLAERALPSAAAAVGASERFWPRELLTLPGLPSLAPAPSDGRGRLPFCTDER